MVTANVNQHGRKGTYSNYGRTLMTLFMACLVVVLTSAPVGAYIGYIYSKISPSNPTSADAVQITTYFPGGPYVATHSHSVTGNQIHVLLFQDGVDFSPNPKHSFMEDIGQVPDGDYQVTVFVKGSPSNPVEIATYSGDLHIRQAYAMPPVFISQKDSGSSIALRQGQTLDVSYNLNSSGYTWDLIQGAESVLQQGERRCMPSMFSQWGPITGVECNHPFKAIAPGKGTLKLIYHQRWMPDVPPLQTIEVNVVVDGGVVAIPSLTGWGEIVFAVAAGLSAAHFLKRRGRSLS